MSRAGRYAHAQNQKRHSQRGFNQPVTKVAETLDTATWMSPGMKACRALASTQDNTWDIEGYSLETGETLTESERQLRQLCKLGFLRIRAERSNGVFSRFVFSMVNINLPQ